jgi:tetratricopeptide (TPR) repeat protein
MKDIKTITTVIGACIIGACGGYFGVTHGVQPSGAQQFAGLNKVISTEMSPTFGMMPMQDARTLSGDYLSSVFAQRHHDWKKAGDYLSSVMKHTPDEPSLLKRAMVLSMGSGDMTAALELAKKVSTTPENNSLATLFLTVGAFHDDNYKGASDLIKGMPPGSLSEFIMPLLASWADAGIGVYNIDGLTDNTLHMHHAVLISDLLGKKVDTESLMSKAVSAKGLNIEDLERMANIYAHLGENTKAQDLYQKIVLEWPEHPTAGKYLAALKDGKKVDPIIPAKSAKDGIAATLYDMANLLYREYADDSARVFAQMALYVMPQMSDARLLVAAIDARNERFEEAINSYIMIKPDSEYFLEAHRKAADLMEDAHATDRALKQLNMLVKDHNDLESLIKIGDIYRRKEDFPKAIEIYNQAASKLGGTVPKEYWNLLYVRGISYERAGQWEKAEADLQASLAYQPDHPFILNYLAYAWADQGLHLDKALTLSKKAAAMQPDDGYIADSLGWVLYRMGKVEESLPQLERAVELLPYDATVNDHLGDAYWQAGRKREAIFQWQRAKNYGDDKELLAKLNDKLENGIPALKTPVKEAHSQATSKTGEVTAIP